MRLVCSIRLSDESRVLEPIWLLFRPLLNLSRSNLGPPGGERSTHLNLFNGVKNLEDR